MKTKETFYFLAVFPGKIFDGSKIGEDIDYQRDRDHIHASWFKIEDPESDIVSLSWCIGSMPGSCDQLENTLIDVTATEISAVLPQPARDGNNYYVTLNAVNGAGLSTTMVSDGVTVDYTQPSPGVVVVGQDNGIEYMKNGDTIYAHWSGFEDTVSGIISCQFALCEVKNKSSCALEFANVALQTNVTLSGGRIFIVGWLGLICFRAILILCITSAFSVGEIFMIPNPNYPTMKFALVNHKENVMRLTTCW